MSTTYAFTIDLPMALPEAIEALLPCGGGAAEAKAGQTRIMLQDPRVIAAQTDNAEVLAACELARTNLSRVITRLRTHQID